ncbi:MAG: response regulator transcription factor [Anaerolineae bacterium]|nr:response regulator transcription factor [Anaerolineae bacterium]
MAPLRLLLVTDAPLVEAGVRVLLEASGEAEVVAVARDAARIAAALALPSGSPAPPYTGGAGGGWGVDLALVDLDMADGQALRLVWWLHDHAPQIEIVALSDDDEAVVVALQAGVRGAVSRRVTAGDLGQALRAVSQGGMALDPLATARLLQRLRAAGEATARPEPLTPREIEVLRLLVEGLTNKAIAARLGISDHTVKFHIGAIMGKLGASSRTEAVTMAVRQGLIPL